MPGQIHVPVGFHQGPVRQIDGRVVDVDQFDELVFHRVDAAVPVGVLVGAAVREHLVDQQGTQEGTGSFVQADPFDTHLAFRTVVVDGAIGLEGFTIAQMTDFPRGTVEIELTWLSIVVRGHVGARIVPGIDRFIPAGIGAGIRAGVVAGVIGIVSIVTAGCGADIQEKTKSQRQQRFHEAPNELTRRAMISFENPKHKICQVQYGGQFTAELTRMLKFSRTS